MNTISKALQGIIFNGAALALASAPWKDKVRAVYGFTSSGTGYEVFNPASQFNSLTELQQDGVYILDVATPGFELPGAVLTAAATAAGPVAGPLSLTEATFYMSDSEPGVRFTIHSTDPTDLSFFFSMLTPEGRYLDMGTGTGSFTQVDLPYAAPWSQGFNGLPSGQYTIQVATKTGYVVKQVLTLAPYVDYDGNQQ